MVENEERVTKEGVLGTWIPLVIVSIVMSVLSFTVFPSWQWWMWLAEMGAAIPLVIVSIFYYGRDSKKCPNCSTRMDYNIEYCKKCGTHIPSKCPECGAAIQVNSAFCEKCGINFAGKQSLNKINKSTINPQYFEESMKDSQGNYKYCPACGNKEKSYAKHCSSCGIEL